MTIKIQPVDSALVWALLALSNADATDADRVVTSVLICLVTLVTAWRFALSSSLAINRVSKPLSFSSSSLSS